jgi:hypothetical protein
MIYVAPSLRDNKMWEPALFNYEEVMLRVFLFHTTAKYKALVFSLTN